MTIQTRADADAAFLQSAAGRLLDEAIRVTLADAPATTHALLTLVLLGTPLPRTGRDVAIAYGMPYETLRSRTHRAGLPSVADLLDHAQLVRVAWLLEDPERTLTDVAYFAGAQRSNLAAWMRRLTGCTGTEWRQISRGTREAERLIARFLLPHVDRWTTAKLLTSLPAAES